MLILQKLSLRRSLVLFSLLTSGAGLLLFCAGFMVYDLKDARDKKVRDLQSVAELVSASVDTSLVFNDAKSGDQVLAAMRVLPGNRAAVLYRMDESTLTWYARKDLVRRFSPPRIPSTVIGWTADSIIC